MCLTSSSAQSTKKHHFSYAAALCLILQAMLGSSCAYEKYIQRVRVKALDPWWTVGGKESTNSSWSTPEQKGRGAGALHLIHHSHANVTVLACERRKLTVLRLCLQLSSRDREVWREANVRCLHEEMNVLATIMVSEEWLGNQHLQLCSPAG